MSLRELWNVLRASTARQTDEHDRDVMLAWQIERMSIVAAQRDGSRMLPSLKTLLQRGRGTEQTPDEQAHMLHALGGLYGLTVTVRKATNGSSHAHG